VERSVDGQGPWSVLAQPDLQASGEHKFIDEVPLPTAYYRLKLIDLDGTFTYSEVVYVEQFFGANAGSMKVYPNPSSGRFTVDLTEIDRSAGEEGELRLVDGTGRMVWSAAVPAGQRELRMDASNSPSGMFILAYIKDDVVVSQRLWIH
ncbi:MAG: T9SS type A sorting domain-containing protein, partial [Bacteroidota bacterium]